MNLCSIYMYTWMQNLHVGEAKRSLEAGNFYSLCEAPPWLYGDNDNYCDDEDRPTVVDFSNNDADEDDE